MALQYWSTGTFRSAGGGQLDYDSENRLISNGSSSLSYVYDAQGRRKAKTFNGTTTVYVTDADNREVLEYDGSSGAIQKWYAYALGPNDVLSQMNVVAGTRAALLPDILGSIIATQDSVSGALTKIGYLPYGKSPSTGPFGFTGQRLDPEIASLDPNLGSLYYYRARHYSPAWGRFLQPDPIGYVGGANLYAYVGNDPLNNVDPGGQFGVVVSLGILGEFGLGPIFGQASGQGSAGLAFLVDTSKFSLSQPTNLNFSVVGFVTTGTTASAFNSNPAPSLNNVSGGPALSQTLAESGSGLVVGASANGGLSFGITNANTASDLKGLSATYSVGAGLGIDASAQFSQSPEGIFVATVSPPQTSVGAGLSVSGYGTNTTAKTLFSTAPSK